MRSNVETKRCGCGNIIGLRESCARCADKARARLHAEGKACKERKSWQAYDNGSEVGRWFIPGFNDPPREWANQAPRAEAAQALRTVNDAVRDGRLVISEAGKELAERLHNTPQSAPCEHPRVLGAGLCHDCGALVSKSAMRQIESRLLAERHATEPQPDNANVADFFIGVDPGYQDTAVAVTSRRRADGTMEIVDVQELAKQEPPPVGAEVSYEVALADMQRRPEARYKECSGAAGTTRWEAGRQIYRMADGSHEWTCANPPWANESFRWTRLPDAETLHAPTDGTPPAIGEEVPWEVAKLDMMQRRAARYEQRGVVGREYAMWYRELITREPDGLWGASVLDDDEREAARWVRLA